MSRLHHPAVEVVYERTHETSLQPVVVLHGLGDSAIHTWMPVFQQKPLAGQSALFIDLPGFGMSRADPDYLATIENHAEIVCMILQREGITHARIFGHSMGANTALVLAHRSPENISKLVLAEPLLHPGHSILAAQITRFSEESYIERGHAMLIRATRQQAGRGDAATRAFLPTITMADARVTYRSASSLLTERHPSFAQMLDDLAPISTLIVGDRSGGKHLDRSGLDGETLLVEDAGHSMHLEQPERTAQTICNALDR